TYLNPWWTASFGDYNNEDCGSLENITITASTTAVRIEDSGTYMCTMNVHNSNGSFFMQIFTINETLTVL
ncbi:hypothetical protein Bpfe_002622, partial [Biomphalaria pfeifferi]